MNTVKTVYFYFIHALRRACGLSKKDSARFVEWKAQFVLMWVEANPIFVLIFLALQSIHRENFANPVVIGPIVGFSVLAANRSFFKKDADWNAYLRQFSAMPRGMRIAADVCVAFIVLLSVYCPLFIFPR